MNKNNANSKCYFSFFASSPRANLSVKVKVAPTTSSSSRTALLNFVKRMDNSGG